MVKLDREDREATISDSKLSTIMAIAAADVCEKQNLDYSYTHFAADLVSEASEYIFGDKQIPQKLEVKCNKFRNGLIDSVNDILEIILDE